MSARVTEAQLQIAERAYAEDLVREHGYVGALRLALRIVERVLTRMSPPEMRDRWVEAAQRPLADLTLHLERLDDAGHVDRPRPRGPRPQA